LKPWQYRSWVFPQDPGFLAKAGRVLDLYQGRFDGKLLHPGDYVICADEKPSIQARLREHETVPPRSGSRGQHATSAAARSPTWPRSTSSVPRCSAAPSDAAASPPSTGSSHR
jgi:hypothetical protein